MRNPIHKRVLRELWIDRGKYLVLFLFLVISIGFASGYFVADGSMLRTYNESFDRYRMVILHSLPSRTRTLVM